MSKKKIILIVLICLMILGLFGLVYFYLDYHLKMCEVPVAKYTLKNRTYIDEETIEMIKVPECYFSDEVYKDKDEVIGKYVKIGAYIPKGSFFYKDFLDTSENMKDHINYDLSENEVSYDLNINDVEANQAYLLNGMYVDIYLTVNKERVYSDLLINNVKIIGLYDINNQEIKDYDNLSILKTICLAVPKNSVSYLNKAKVLGQLSITIGDNTYEDVDSILNRNSTIFDFLE